MLGMHELWESVNPHFRPTAEGRCHAVTRVKRTADGTLFNTMCGEVTYVPKHHTSQHPCSVCEAAFREVAVESA